MLAEEEIKTSLEMEHLSVMLQELLGLITELVQVPTPGTTPFQLSLIDLALHLMTDLETALIIFRTTLEKERLIHNDLRFDDEWTA